jgi:predicted DNA-binding transcriptional regulator AlpA
MSADNPKNKQPGAPVLTVVRSTPEAPAEIPPLDSDLVDEIQLAARLGIARSTLQSWRYSGRGPRFIKLGRLIRYRNVDVDAFLLANTRGCS